MKTLAEFLTQLRSLGIKLWLEEDNLRFRAPKGVFTKQLKAQLLANKVAVIDYIREADSALKLSVQPIRPARRPDLVPLSFAQQRLWFLHHLEPKSYNYNIPMPLRLIGPLEVWALKVASDMLVQRHESLRTCFQELHGQPYQVVHDLPASVFSEVDLSGQPPESLDRLVTGLTRTHMSRPFDLKRGPLLQVDLLTLNPVNHVLLVNMHHIVSDGWSMGIFRREICQLYEAISHRHQPSLPPPLIQYADYALWQRQWLQGDVLDQHLHYWRSQLAGDFPPLEPAFDHPRPAFQSHQGALQTISISRNVLAKIKVLSQELGATLFMTLLAAFKVLMMRYTGQPDIIIGTPIANRNRAETESVIGYFVNTLALRTQLSGQTSFRDLVSQVRQMALDAFTHQDLPFEQIVAEVQPVRDLSRSALFQVLFEVISSAQPSQQLSDLQIEALSSEMVASKFDLEMNFNAENLTCSLNYPTDLYEDATIRRMLQHFKNLLAAIAAVPDRPIDRLELMGSDERNLQLQSHERDSIELPVWIRKFDGQVANSPNSIALVPPAGQQLNYTTLNAQANRLASKLRGLNLDPNIPVAICLPRSEMMVIALLAVHKAGAAYLPMDPAYPEQRLAFMLADSGATVVLSDRQWAPDLSTKLLFLNPHQIMEQGPIEQINCCARQDQLSHLIYTSGSTGRPKGVALCHRSVTALAYWADRFYKASDWRGVLASTSICFDLSVFEIFVTLAQGGTIVLAENALHLRELKADVTLINTVPSVMTQLIELGLPSSVCVVNLAGEPLPRSLVDKIYDLTQVERVYNLYGPSEDTTYSTAALVPAKCGTKPLIGKPLDHSSVCLADRYLELTPFNLVGEILLAGQGLARGYLGRPRQTALAFVPNPFSDLPGDRLYRSGDLARFRHGFDLDFLGRLDHQVKLRGYRIELGEVESALQAHQQLNEAVAMVQGQRLVAFASKAAHAGDLDALLVLDQVSARIPRHLVPNALVILDALPRLPNGKVDRHALPSIDPDLGTKNRIYVAPRNEMESLVADIFAQVLGRSQIGVHDHFFQLGGHSLLAVQAVSRLQNRLQQEVALRTFFEEPTVMGLAAALERQKFLAPRFAAPILPSARDALSIPLSFAQQRLWFLDRLSPGSPLYNMPMALLVKGWLDISALETAYTKLVARHESLRTSFVERHGLAEQIIADPPACLLLSCDLSRLNDPFSLARSLAEREALLPFQLEHGPLLRLSLMKLDPQSHVLILNMHHIISDGWSLTIFIRELIAFYLAALNADSKDPLAALPIQCADYAIWQRNLLQGELLEQHLHYWRTQLAGELTPLEPVLDYPRPPVMGYRGASQTNSLGEEVPAKLEALGLQLGATPFMVYLSAFKTLMLRYSGQSDLIIGTPIANRNRSETEALIGFFVNTLALRTRIQGNPRYRDLVGTVRGVALGAYAHQELPFEQIVAELQPDRDLSRSPLFQVMIALNTNTNANQQLAGLQETGLQLEPLASDREAAKFDLHLELSSNGQTMTSTLKYRTDLYKPKTIQRMLGHFKNLLNAIVADPDSRLGCLQLMSPDEQSMLLAVHNRAQGALVAQTVYQLFEAQVARDPNQIALMMEDGRSLSYGELNRRANQLAHYLRQRGVAREDAVGIYLERSPEMAVAQIASFKSGGVYVPLAPDLPLERLEFMIQDCRAAVIVSHSAVSKPLCNQDAFVNLDKDTLAIEASNERNPNARLSPDNLAYILYTSGSTGQPKGVQLTHNTFANHVQTIISTFKHGVHTRVYQFASFNFDASLAQFWPPLCCGGRVVMRGPEIPDPAKLGQKILDWGITHLGLTTAYWQQLVREWHEQGQTEIGSLETASVGGDVMDAETMKLWQDTALNRVGLYNSYGPTETVITATYFKMPVNYVPSRQTPIGQTLVNRSLYIFDKQGRPVPFGVPGQLMIGGHILARGYLNRPRLTAQQFVPDPHATEAGRRLYQSGDLVRMGAEDNIIFLGRMDQQVKVRGYRIELPEIEAVLSQHETLKEAVVLAPLDHQGQRYLAGYLVPAKTLTADEQETLIRELRQWAKHKLPDYMTPTNYKLLERFPLNNNGKVDRRALPKIEHNQDREVIAPRNDMEELVAQIFGQLLGREQLGIHDHFFELGGHSLLATQAVSRLRKQLNIEVGLRLIFEEPTVITLAAALQRLKHQAPQTANPIRPRGTGQQAIPLSFAQQRLWFLDRLSPGSPHYNMPMALQIKGALAIDAVQTAHSAMLVRHESLRTTFTEEVGTAEQRIGPALEEQLPLIDLQGLREPLEQARIQAAAEALDPFSLERGPLLRVRLFRLEPQLHAMTVTLHHIISDGWSMEIFIREWMTYYEAAVQRTAVVLPQLTIQYADFTLWQRDLIQGEVQEQHLQYWRTQLAGELTPLEPVLDHPRPPHQSNRGAQQTHTMTAGIPAKMAALGRQEGATTFMLYLAAFMALMQRYTGQTDIIIGTPIANRNRAETESLIGFFVNTLALRMQVQGKTPFRELVTQVRHMTLEAYTYQDLPFEQIVAALQPDRDLSRTPLFQVMFALTSKTPTRAAPCALLVEPLTTETCIAKFDIDMNIVHSEDTLTCTLTYNTDLYEDGTIRRMLGHFKSLLTSIAADSHQAIEALTLMEPSEKRQLLEMYDNDPGQHSERAIHQLFEAQAARTPERLALKMDDGRAFSYAELNRRANQLAHHLRHHGVTCEAAVALYLQRSPEMAIAQIATYKAGGIYVPMAPELPQERLAFMLQDSQAAVIVSHDAIELALNGQGIETLNLDRDAETIGAYSGKNLGLQMSPYQSAYIIYTSGSTGKPKGVLLCHGVLSRHMQEIVGDYQLQEDCIVYQFASFNFDASLEQFWIALILGGQVVMRGRETTSPRLMCQKLLEWKVTHIGLTPAYWSQLVREWHDLGQTELSGLRSMSVGGDVMPPETIKLWQQTVLNRIILFNSYGPTEAMIACTSYLVPKDFEPGLHLPIGKSLRGRTCYILDANGALAALGVPGELAIGGPLLASGYLNRPRLAAAQFVPDPFGHLPGSRLYKSGDLVRSDSTGEILYLGRIDQQVKIRGYRIELQEIETVLRERVTEAVVLALEDAQGEKYLAAYIVNAEDEDEQLIAELRERVKSKLPNYMEPTAYCVLASLPLNANGKLDRRALPKAKQKLESGELESPRNPTEQQLLTIWQEVLPAPCLSIHDNFFEHGGHSMAALRMLGLIEKHIQVQLSVTHLFQHPTVAELSQLIENKAVITKILHPIKPEGQGRPWYFVHPIGGQVHWYYELAQAMARPFYGIQSPRPDEAPDCLAGLASLYIEQIKSHQPEGPYLLGGWSLGGTIAFEMARQLEETGASVDKLVLLDAWRLERDELLPQDPDKNLLHFITELAGDRELGIEQILAERGGRDDATLLAAMHEQLLEKGIVPADFPISYVTDLYRTYTHNARLVADSPAFAEYGGEVVWIQAASTILARRARHKTGKLDWQHSCKQQIAIKQVAGDHYTILSRERVSETAALLERLASLIQ